MKIELPNGITIHLEDGENIDAVLPLLRPGDPTPRLTAEEEAVDPGQTIPPFVKNDGLTAAPAPLVSDALKTRMLAELDGHLREVAALRAEVAALRQRVADLAADRDTWRSRREGNW